MLSGNIDIFSPQTFQFLSELVKVFVFGLTLIASLSDNVIRDLLCFFVNLDEDTDFFLH